MSANTNQPLSYSGVNAGRSDGAQQRAAGAADQGQNKAQQAAGQAQEKLREQLNQRSSQVATQISEQASDLRSVGQTLREQGKEGPAKAAERLAGYTENVGGYLRDKDSDQLLADAEDFGRRQPWAIAAGGLALGFAASRFLKASSSRRYQKRSQVSQSDHLVTAETSASPASPTAGEGLASQPAPVAPVYPGAAAVI